MRESTIAVAKLFGRQSVWLVLALAAAAYLSMYTDGATHGAAFGAAGEKLAYLHEFFHHARHLGFACH